MGTKAPLIHNICMIDTLEYHLSVMEITINSSAMIPSPSMAGNEMKAVKRNILRNIPLLSVGIFRYFRKYRLCHSVYHAQYELLSHAAPFVGLVVIAHFYLGVVLTQYDGEEIVVDVIEYVGN